MGMAASQSRYLGLTARKINVEYEGQQVNQQRTALANESAGLFRQLMGLEVPTAPSQHDYYETQYSYADPSSSDGRTVVSSYDANPNSDPQTYTVVLTSKENVWQYNTLINQSVSVTHPKDYEIHSKVGSFTLSTPIEGLSQSEIDEFNSIGNVSYKNEITDTYYKFTNTAINTSYYINATKTGFDPAVETTQNVDFFTKMTVTQDTSKTIRNAQFGSTSNGTFNSIYWIDDDGHTNRYTLSQTQKYDETGYNDAMAQYNHDKQVYEQTVAEINAKTKKLEETDRTLELRLKQLDTEQEALQTEMEAVKKVIDKNVENVFKTFQG